MVVSPHVLVVEDDRQFSRLVARYLETNDYRVSIAADGRAMERALNSCRIDLIVLDLMLPGRMGSACVDACANHRGFRSSFSRPRVRMSTASSGSRWAPMII
jgi:DNA-binding response OmpR family regulator